MRILVTGGFGYLGAAMAELLKAHGREVRLLVRSVPDYMSDWAQDFDVRKGDITDEESLEGCCEGIDAVVHTAAANEILCTEDERAALLVNGYGTRNIVKQAVQSGVGKFVYFSTFHVYGPQPGQVIDEASDPIPVHSYGLTHLVGELYVLMATAKSAGLTSTSLRISNGYGAPVRREIPRWTLVMNDLCRLAQKERKIVLKSSGKQSRDFVAIHDIYQALCLVLDRDDGRYELYNVGGENTKTILEIAELVQAAGTRIYGREIPIEIQGRDEPAQPQVVFNIDKLKGLGFTPGDHLSEEIERILDLLEAG